MTTQETVYVLWEDKHPNGSFAVVGAHYPLQELTVEGIGQLSQQGYMIWLVLPAKSCTIHQVNLPKLNAKDIPAAIVSTLEDRVIQDFSNLWWFYQKASQDLYNVFIWDKSWLDSVRQFWAHHNIQFAGITLDWFALKPREVFILNRGDALIRSDDHNGCLPHQLFLNWIKDKSFEANIYYAQFQLDFPGAQFVGCSWPEWMAQRFSEQAPVNIDQNSQHFDLKNYIQPEQIEKYFPQVIIGALGFIALVFLVLFGKNTVMYFQNLKEFRAFSNTETGALEKNLATYQRQQAQKKQFWSIWIALQKSIQPKIKIQQIKFEQNKMQLFLELPNINSLQQLKNKLIRQNIKILQSQVQTIPNGVRVVLQLQGRA
jgi:general secretion pathway protein L